MLGQLFVPAILLPFVSATTYPLVKEYSGTSFFDGWDFYGAADNLTNGDAFFVSAQQATSAKLAYVDPNTKRAIIKVDNTSTVPFNDKRNTVRITTQELYPIGSVWVSDMHHVPYGCSVWPAFWSHATNWPNGGEVDTFEGANQVTHNQMALHTAAGCTQVSPVQSSTLINSTNCDVNANSNQGCIVLDPSTASYGKGFADADGGVFVTELTSTGVSIWFFTRSQIPSSISSNTTSIDTSTLGTPVANYPSGGCQIDKFFTPQQLTFDITLCGDLARNTLEAATCPLTNGTNACYTNYVLGPASNYDTAYFDVSYVRVYSNGQTTTTSTKNSASTMGSRQGLLAFFLVEVAAFGLGYLFLTL